METITNLRLILIGLISINGSCIRGQAKLIGMTSEGGAGAGVIFSMPTGGTAITSQLTFTISSGAIPYYLELLEASNGKIYGMTSAGGSSNNGTLFEYDISANTYMVKVH